MSRLSAVSMLLLLTMGLLGCLEQKEPETSSAPAGGGGEGDRLFHARLLEIAGSYGEYHSVNEEAHWAPVTCQSFASAFSPRPPAPPIEPLLSASGDSTTHGRKLYWLFAKEMPESGHGDYTVPGKPNPVGQVVVKEAWLPKEVKDEETLSYAKKELTSGAKGSPFARQPDGRVFQMTSKSALFIMYKTEPHTPGTDQGWVYGTVTPDGKEVTSAGRVESCMNCHIKAPHDRLFGQAKKTP
jgi:hypothetical protein